MLLGFWLVATLAQAGEAEFRPLLTAETLPNWRRTGGATFSWEDGALHGRDAGERNSFLVAPEPYGDFELRCAVWIEAGGNSGIQVRSRVDEAGDFVAGWQIEIETTERRWSGGLYEERGRGWLDPLEGQEPARAAFRVGEWNDYRILCRGSRVRAWVNGIACADYEDPSAPARGALAFQVHGGARTSVRWRDLRIREIQPEARPFSFSAWIGDGAVLAADGAVIRGWAPPQARVDLRLSPPRAAPLELSALADAAGAWRVELPAQEPGGPYVVEAACADPSAGAPLLARDLWFGDVWLCSGQSNMEWSLGQSNFAAEEIAAAALPQVRFFTVPRVLAAERAEDLPRGAAPGAPGAWTPCAPEHAAQFSAVAYHFARALAPHARRPLGIVVAAWGGTPAEAWTPWSDLKAQPRLRALAEGEGPTPPQWAEGSWDASAIFHGMIAPLRDLRPRGVIWYQGESNASRAAEYEHLFPALIRAWRREFEAPLLPFLFVQLAGFRAPAEAPVQTGSWAELREAQRLTALRTPATGMAVAIDVGEARDIHPRDKRTVGERLARQARAVAYGEEVLAAGPAPRTLEIGADGVARLRFDHAGGGLIEAGGGMLRGFALAGADGVFHAASAAIRAPDQVEMRAGGVPAPVEVRYGWADNPGCNLANREGLPAAPFRMWPTADLLAAGLAEAWTGADGAAPAWEEADGVITVRPGAGSILTRAPLAACELSLEFRLPTAAGGAAAEQHGNSGVYLQRRYEVQILDSFARPLADDSCGALYRQRAPAAAAALPAGSWQRYQITFTPAQWGADGARTAPARVSVWLNGALIHDDVALSGKTGAGLPEGPEPLPLLLQDHGASVAFRNVLLTPR